VFLSRKSERVNENGKSKVWIRPKTIVKEALFWNAVFTE
jgi:hypothetical protein